MSRQAGIDHNSGLKDLYRAGLGIAEMLPTPQLREDLLLSLVDLHKFVGEEDPRFESFDPSCPVFDALDAIIGTCQKAIDVSYDEYVIAYLTQANNNVHKLLG